MAKKIPLLTSNDIEVKVKQCTQDGAVALLYKTARVDMAILDEVYGSENWTDDYREIKGNLYCGIGTRTTPEQSFVWKWDCGIESKEDGEGNQKKGEASDAFKRAGFKWGIGRELYTAPFIFLNVPTNQAGTNSRGKAIYELKDRFARFTCSEIGYDAGNRINRVVIIDKYNNVVFTTGKNPTPKPKTTPAEPTEPVEKPVAPAEKPKSNFQRIRDLIGNKVEVSKVSELQRLIAPEKTRVNDLTELEMQSLIGMLQAEMAKGESND